MASSSAVQKGLRSETKKAVESVASKVVLSVEMKAYCLAVLTVENLVV